MAVFACTRRVNFFAEIDYRAADNTIESVKAFKSTTSLEPYLNLVDLSKLLKLWSITDNGLYR